MNIALNISLILVALLSCAYWFGMFVVTALEPARIKARCEKAKQSPYFTESVGYKGNK